MSFRAYESSLRKKVLDWIDKNKIIDLLVGIPSFNNEKTISYVMEQVGKGLDKEYHDLKTAIFVSDGGSTDNTRENANKAEVPESVSKIIQIYRGVPGKGTSLRSIFEAGVKLNSKVIICLDADLKSIKPEWIKYLAKPVLEKNVDFISPLYKRHKYDGTITKMIVYPVTRALYGKDIRQPIGGDFSFSGDMAKLYSSKNVWTTDVAKFGIDIWMTTVAINESKKMGQVNLGAKIHSAKDPARDLEQMFVQVISTLFYMLDVYKSNWIYKKETEAIKTYNGIKDSFKIPEIDVDLRKLEMEFMDGFSQFKPFYNDIFSHSTYEKIEKAYNDKRKGKKLNIDGDLWSKIIYDSAITYHLWSRNRRRLVNIIVPLYFGRIASYIYETRDMDWEQAEKVVQRQAEIFEENKKYISQKISLWEKL